MNNTVTVINIDPDVFTAEYITSHLIPVVQRPTEDNTLVKDYFLDLELIYKVVLSDSDVGLTTYRLTKDLADSLALDADCLRRHAKECARETITCQSMGEIFGIPDAMTEMYVLSNQSRNLGSGAAFICTEKMQELAEKWQTAEIVVLPSSIHELIVIKADLANEEYINQMIREVNAGMVDAREQLSDHLYVYHADSDTFTA